MGIASLEFHSFGPSVRITIILHAAKCQPFPAITQHAPSWDSPPLSLESWPSAADQQWEVQQASHSMPSLATIAPSLDFPTSSLAVSPPPRSLLASAQIPQTVPSPMVHAYMDEQLDGVAASKPQPILAISWQPSSQPMATNAAAATWVYKDFMTKGQLQHQWEKHGGLQFFLWD
ncbi:hypothetical protein F5J12DRAFT_784980 [Pisolithus orientalis]|uniref:uncharacterized protein n=1 Tax=Pisolithus orientalis TaxID=936130 RepID=UPI0022253732|nr:uncharacterized protein F5J12DRAFT_784980 [Pisolithus orientalis]KAI5998408.1 hypothetical protein F5J12DRAFT_784980 [Pisolithus orientalis]